MEKRLQIRLNENMIHELKGLQVNTGMDHNNLIRYAIHELYKKEFFGCIIDGERGHGMSMYHTKIMLEKFKNSQKPCNRE